MTEPANLKSHLMNLSLDESNQLVTALNICGSELGLWGINGLKKSHLRRFMSKRAREAAYIAFDIPKKAGGKRRISAPITELSQIQQALNLLLQSVCEVSWAAMGFVPGRSIVNNAEVHVGSSVIFNCDLKDFFPSITKSMVRESLTAELASLNASREVINLICNLATAPRRDGVEALPQGAPTSPVISNIVLKSLDRRLSIFAEKNAYRYTRYADDITFSHSGHFSPSNPIKSDAIVAIILDCGFTVNPKKTVIQTAETRREVTGLKVSKKVNVSRKYIKQLRSLLYLWESYGLEIAQSIVRERITRNSKADLTKIINGKINYLRMVKGKDDPVYRKFKYRYRKQMMQLKALKTEQSSQMIIEDEELDFDLPEDAIPAEELFASLRQRLSETT